MISPALKSGAVPDGVYATDPNTVDCLESFFIVSGCRHGGMRDCYENSRDIC